MELSHYLNYHITKYDNRRINNRSSKSSKKLDPFLNSDGDISLVSIEEGKHVKVRLEGACTSCSVNQMTLRAGVDNY
jgi:Fe-S cluster biogenesis protein NfuA